MLIFHYENRTKPLTKYFDREDLVRRKLSSDEFDKIKNKNLEIYKSRFGRLQFGNKKQYFNPQLFDSDLNFEIKTRKDSKWKEIERKERTRSLEEMAANTHQLFEKYNENDESVLSILDNFIDEINWANQNNSVFLNSEFLDEIEKYLKPTHGRLDDEINDIFDDRTGCELYSSMDYTKEKLTEFLVQTYQIMCRSVSGTLENRDLVENILLEKGLDQRMSLLFEDFFHYITSTDVDIVIDVESLVTACNANEFRTESDNRLKEGFSILLEERMRNPVMMERSHSAIQVLAIYNNEGREESLALLRKLQTLQEQYTNTNIQLFLTPILKKIDNSRKVISTFIML